MGAMSQSKARIVDVSEEIARSLNYSDIKYSILSGIEHYPAEIGRDLDILVQEESIEGAREIILKVLNDRGWVACCISRPWASWIIAFHMKEGTPVYFEVDIFSRLQWFASTLVEFGEEAEEIGQKGVFATYAWGIFVKQILMQTLGRQFDRLDKKCDQIEFSVADWALVARRLEAHFGKGLAASIVGAVENGDVNWLRQNAGRMRWKVVGTTVLRFRISLFRSLYRWAVNECHQTIFPSRIGPIIALVGPDGAGKTSVSNEICNAVKQGKLFGSVIVRHWRPGILPQLGSVFGRGDVQPHDHSPRRSAGRFGMLRRLYYSVDFFLGHWLRDRRESAGINLIVYDRHYLDTLVDPVRYGFNRGMALAELYAKIIPQPDIIFFLEAEPATIRARKPELPIDEIVRQNAKWNNLLQLGKVDEKISTDVSSQKVAEEIISIVVDRFIKRINRYEDK